MRPSSCVDPLSLLVMVNPAAPAPTRGGGKGHGCALEGASAPAAAQRGVPVQASPAAATCAGEAASWALMAAAAAAAEAAAATVAAVATAASAVGQPPWGSRAARAEVERPPLPPLLHLPESHDLGAIHAHPRPARPASRTTRHSAVPTRAAASLCRPLCPVTQLPLSITLATVLPAAARDPLEGATSEGGASPSCSEGTASTSRYSPTASSDRSSKGGATPRQFRGKGCHAKGCTKERRAGGRYAATPPHPLYSTHTRVPPRISAHGNSTSPTTGPIASCTAAGGGASSRTAPSPLPSPPSPLQAALRSKPKPNPTTPTPTPTPTPAPTPTLTLTLPLTPTLPLTRRGGGARRPQEARRAWP